MFWFQITNLTVEKVCIFWNRSTYEIIKVEVIKKIICKIINSAPHRNKERKTKKLS